MSKTCRKINKKKCFLYFYTLYIWSKPKMLYVMLTFEKTPKYYFLNRIKYIESNLMKSSGKISGEHWKQLV